MPATFFNIASKFSAPESLERFRRYFDRYSIALFDYTLLPKALHGLYSLPLEVGYKMVEAFCRKIGRPEMTADCVVAYIDSDQFEAYAVEDGGKYYVAISAALPALIQALYNNMLSYTNPFSPFSDSAVEEYFMFSTSLGTEEIAAAGIHAEIERLVEETMPEEKWQRVLAVKLAELAITFCIAHEIGHVVSGHAFLSGKRHPLCMAEKRVSAAGRPIGFWVSHAWEIEADRVGIALLYSYVINTPRQREKFRHHLRCKTTPELYGRIIHAVYIVFLILGQHDKLLRTGHSHPAAVTRFTFLMSFLGTLLADMEGHSSDEAALVMEKHADMAEAAWKNLGFSAERPDTIDDLMVVVTELSRACDKTHYFYGSHQWAYLFGN